MDDGIVAVLLLAVLALAWSVATLAVTVLLEVS